MLHPTTQFIVPADPTCIPATQLVVDSVPVLSALTTFTVTDIRRDASGRATLTTATRQLTPAEGRPTNSGAAFPVKGRLAPKESPSAPA
jgi:hypothetical protein